MNILKKIKKDQSGAAIVFALIVMTVLMLFAALVCLVSYSLYASSLKQVQVQQCKETAISLSKQLQAEITEPVYSSYQEQKKAEVGKKDPLWFYLRYNIWPINAKNNWPYYNSGEKYHTADYADRYFKLNADDTTVVNNSAGDTEISMRWESSKDAETRSDIELKVSVTCKKGEQAYRVTSRYSLNITHYEDVGNESDGGTVETFNPGGNTIKASEKWQWSLLGRE